MYISKLIIKGFRGFNCSEIQFQNGLNVIIGHNNGGKSTIIKALRLVLEYGTSKTLTAWDFCQNREINELKSNAPCIEISVFIKEDKDEGMTDDIALFTNYAIQAEPLLESCLTYVYYLPLTESEKYKNDVADINDKYSLFKTIEDKYIRKYTYSIYGGPLSRQNQALGEDLKKIDFEFVDALRNVDVDIYSGKATLLREVLKYFLDYDLNEDKKRVALITERHKDFINATHDVIKTLVGRIKTGKDNIIDYANRTGALLSNNKLSFEGEVTESDLLMVLNLLIGNDEGMKVPVSLNGLGYNNLIYISLLLAKMQSNSKADFMGATNVKAFSLLAIEEPEAHLHPQMQYQFLEFLRQNIQDRHVKQVFVTSHSPSLVANVKLDELCCLHKSKDGNVNIYSPKKVFDSDDKGKKFIQRYLDATRADMLFAGGIIFVEGIAEQILLPVFARLINKYDKWLKKHIIVVNISGRYFDNFLKLYNSDNPDALKLKVACITDRDPVRKEKCNENAKYYACWPIEYDVDKSKYDYNNHSSSLLDDYKSHPNIKFFSQDEKGKTLEYEIAIQNPNNHVILVDSLANKEEIKQMMEAKDLRDALYICKSDKLRILYSDETIWSDSTQRYSALIASRYLDSVSKGENALELANALMDLSEEDKSKFNVPDYIKAAIEWILA